MQRNERSNENEGGEDGREAQKQTTNHGQGAEAADEVADEAEGEAPAFNDEATTATVIIVPTKTEDGGSNQQENQSHNQGQGRTNSTRPDAFRTYSDTDTRMLTLLGLETSANPNDGEREDWRQLTGFRGIGEERRRHNDENGITPRRTRLSTELHINAFENMWLRRGELNLDHEPPRGQPPRQQEEEEGHDGSDEGE
jgi:hypothetical protein